MDLAKPRFESVPKTLGNSFTMRRFDQPCPTNLRNWHYHPEIELVFVKNGHGRRHIGYHLSYFQDGDLVLIGSNLPHSGFSDRLCGKQEEFVIQLQEDFLGKGFFDLPELHSIRHLIQKAQRGIAFHGHTKTQVGHLLEGVIDQTPFERLMTLLSILHILSQSEELEFLNATDVSLEVNSKDRQRIDHVIKYVTKHYIRPISLKEVADLANLTETSFSRYFKDSTGKTFIQFLNEYRLIHAMKLMTEHGSSMTEICFAVGFNNYSHFTKQFKTFTGTSPREYLRALKQVV